MVDRSRILLCVLTFLCLSFNPLTALLQWGGAHDSDQHPYSGSGRSVLSLESGGWRALMPPQRGLAAVEETGLVCKLLSLLARSQRALAVGPHLLASGRDWHKSHFGSNRANLSSVRKRRQVKNPHCHNSPGTGLEGRLFEGGCGVFAGIVQSVA